VCDIRKLMTDFYEHMHEEFRATRQARLTEQEREILEYFVNWLEDVDESRDHTENDGKGGVVSSGSE